MSRYNQRPKTRPNSAKSSRPGKRRFGEKMASSNQADSIILFGFHTVIEALRNPNRKVIRLMATENAMRRLNELDVKLACPQEVTTTSAITRLTGPEAVHQGLALEVTPLPAIDLQAVMERPGPIVVLDQITDPHNVGAILRSCAAFNVAGIVVTARHSPAETSVLAKSASGALEHVPFARVTNLSKAIEQLQASRITCIGLDSEAEYEIETLMKDQKRIALVFGAEGKGLRQKTRETCAALGRIDMPGAIRSLNVSNAAALGLYIVTRS